MKTIPTHQANVLVVIAMGLLFVVSIGLACNAPADTNDTSLTLTKAALDYQATSQAMELSQSQLLTQQALDLQAAQLNQQATQNAQNQQMAQQATQMAQSVQATLISQQATQLAQATIPPTAPKPTKKPEKTQPPTKQPTTVPPTPTPNIDDLIQNSNILLFEDITSIYQPRYVKQALDGMGLSNNYVDVKDAVGNFKAELLSGTKWDLIIAAVEARTNVQGEFFEYINDHLNKGAGVIIEHWNLDDLSAGKASLILTRCGVKIRDWSDPPNSSRSIWFLQGENPIFHEPNEGISLANYSLYWFGDAGDLMRKSSGTDAILLAGIYAQEKNDYGTLVSCEDGRLILQTFSSHDYHQDDMVRLWQNYIYNALQAHFAYINK